MPEEQDWFSQNAPKQQGDWFAANAPHPDFAKNPPGVARPLPGALNPSFKYDPERKGSGEIGGGPTISQSLKSAARGPAMGAATVAPMLTGGMALPAQMAVGGMSGAAQDKLLGGSNKEALASGAIGTVLPAIGPALNSRLGRTIVEGGKAAAGRIPFVGPPIRAGLRAASREWSQFPVERQITRQMVPEYAGELGEGESEALTRSAPRGIAKPNQPPNDLGKPSGRLVLSPAQAQQEEQQMRLAKRMASQRGMQYAAGIRPKD